MIYLYSDVLGRSGGIETYLHALATKLWEEKRPFRVAVSEQEVSPVVGELVEMGIDVYRQRLVPGDRWHLRKRLLLRWLRGQLMPGDWVFCVRQPMAQLYFETVRAVHSRGARIAASWMFAPEFLIPPRGYEDKFNQAVRETDVVVSVSKCTAHQFGDVYGYTGSVQIIRYHNLPIFQGTVPLPPGPPWKIGYMGRLDTNQKNLDTLITAFALLSQQDAETELHFYGRGPSEKDLAEHAQSLGMGRRIFFHGAYDHRKDLPGIVGNCHFFVYPSRFEGGPCFSLLEILQAGRFCVASPVGGIPDIYQDHPEAGLLVAPDNPAEISEGLGEAVRRMASGYIDSRAIRQRYIEEFDMKSAHRDWLAALDLSV